MNVFSWAFFPLIAAKPKMPQLRSLEDKQGTDLNIIDYVQASWSELSDFLELPSNTVRNLQRLDPEDACRRVFELWLDGEGEQGEPTNWYTIISVLRKMKLKTFAEQVRQALVDWICGLDWSIFLFVLSPAIFIGIVDHLPVWIYVYTSLNRESLPRALSDMYISDVNLFQSINNPFGTVGLMWDCDCVTLRTNYHYS